jgi:single-strand DNA-binding protein
MASDLNVWSGIGRLTRDIETRSIGEGVVAVFGVAVGNYKEEKTLFLDCELWGKQVDTLVKFFVKGDPIALTGSLETDKWVDKNSGDNRSKIKLRVNTFAFVPRTKDKPPTEDGEAAPKAKAKKETKVAASTQDADIPF